MCFHLHRDTDDYLAAASLSEDKMGERLLCYLQMLLIPCAESNNHIAVRFGVGDNPKYQRNASNRFAGLAESTIPLSASASIEYGQIE